MSFLGRAKAAYRALTREQFDALGLLGPPTLAGVHVTQQTANTVAAYWNGVCVIAGDLGVMDRHLYRRVGDDDRERATSNPAYKLIREQPNPETTAMQFWETISSHAVSWGNGYAEIEYDNALRPIALWIILPDQIEPKVETFIDRRGRTTSRKYYVYRGQTRLEYEDVLHISGLGFDGIRGYSPVALARQSLGLSIASERFGATFFGNGGFPGIAFQHPDKLSEEAQRNLKKSIHEKMGGDNAHSIWILEEGMKVSKPISIPPDDAQFLETRQFQIEEIARWLNVPPHKLKHQVNQRPGGNFEASELDYQVTTLLPWATRIEQECDRKLIAPSQRGTYYTEHNFSKRLKTDTNTRVQSYKTFVDLGVLNAEQIARMENLPKPKAKEEPPRQARAAPQPRALDDQQPVCVRKAQEALLLSEIGRFMRREAEQARRAAKKTPEAFGQWVEDFYGMDQEGVLAGSMKPAVRLSLALMGLDEGAGEVSRVFAKGYLATSKAALLQVRAKDLAVAVPAALKRWESARALESLSELTLSFEAAEEKEEEHG